MSSNLGLCQNELAVGTGSNSDDEDLGKSLEGMISLNEIKACKMTGRGFRKLTKWPRSERQFDPSLRLTMLRYSICKEFKALASLKLGFQRPSKGKSLLIWSDELTLS